MSLESSFQQLREANPVPDPALLTDGSTDSAGLLAAAMQRSTDMQTQEPIRTETPPPAPRPWLIAAAAFVVVIVIGALLVIPNLGGSSDVIDQPTTTSTVAPPTSSVDVGAAAPIQVLNDQGSRATIDFAGNAKDLVEGGAYLVDIQMEIEPDFNSPGITVRLVSIDGETTTTGITEDGATFTPTWAWTADGDAVTVTMVGRGVSIPDTRPAVVVSVQETDASPPVEFVLTAAAGSGRPG